MKRTKVLTFILLTLVLLAIASAGSLYYRTTPHYLLRHDYAADVTLDNGNVVRFIRHYEHTPEGLVFYDELDVYRIVDLCSDDLVIPEKVGGYPVTAFGKHTPVAFFADTNSLQVKKLTLPDTMKNVGAGNFSNLEYLDIGNSTAYGLCQLDAYNLKDVKVSPDNARYKLENGCLVYKENGDLVFDYTVE